MTGGTTQRLFRFAVADDAALRSASEVCRQISALLAHGADGFTGAERAAAPSSRGGTECGGTECELTLKFSDDASLKACLADDALAPKLAQLHDALAAVAIGGVGGVHAQSFWFEHEPQAVGSRGGSRGAEYQRSVRIKVSGADVAAEADRLAERCAQTLRGASAATGFLGVERVVCSRTWDYELKYRFGDAAGRDAAPEGAMAELAAQHEALARLAHGGEVEWRSMDSEPA